MPFTDLKTGFEVWLCLGGALLLDGAWGEMPRAIHPVVFIGKPIRWFKNLGLRRPWSQFLGGLLLVILLPLGCAWLSAILLWETQGWSGLELVLRVFLLKATFASKALGEAGLRIEEALKDQSETGLAQARYALRSLCSRDARDLDEAHVVGATVASLAENLSDSVIAPVFFYLVAGIPGAIFYRVVNTMDAVLGYRGPLEYLGKAAARTDDIVNLIPARITSFCLLLATPPREWKKIGTLVWQEAGKTPSPNGGWPMAAMAGALEISLIKKGVYQLGAFPDMPRGEHITEAWAISRRATWIFLSLAWVVFVCW
jgi:adenosylcobinamide-phosphate synthase